MTKHLVHVSDLNASYNLEPSSADPREAEWRQSWPIDIQGKHRCLLFSDTMFWERFVTQQYSGNSWLIHCHLSYLSKTATLLCSLLASWLLAMYRVSSNSLPWHSEPLPIQLWPEGQSFCKAFPNWIGSPPLGFQSRPMICYNHSRHTGYH